MSYKRNELLESLLRFKLENGRFPSGKDFQLGSISPGRSTFYRVFGSIERAVGRALAYENGALEIEGKNNYAKPPSKPVSGKMACPFCGGLVDRISEYYSSLVDILSSRFIALLQSANGKTYIEGILDCIHAVFGPGNPVLRKALHKSDFLSQFEDRHKTIEPRDDR